MTANGLDRVVLAISAFRSDESVINLLSRAFQPETTRFGAVIVVDSLGSGAIAQAIAANGWAARYVNAETNLGSAGNLDLRLTLAEETGLDWCLALNHDGELDPAKALRLLECGESGERVGAVYPTLRMTSAGGRLDRPRRSFSTFGILAGEEPRSATSEVSWSSSNGALYRLDAIREGANAWPQLWMGYEDLAIGWELRRRRWRQLLSADVVVDDNYEFRPVTILGTTVHIADKPVWYSYYQLRNLALIARGTGGDAIGWTSIARRGVMDFLLLVFRRDRWKRAKLLARGLRDGMRGIGGIGDLNR